MYSFKTFHLLLNPKSYIKPCDYTVNKFATIGLSDFYLNNHLS